MSIIAAACNSYKLDLLSMLNVHEAADVFKIALYEPGATIGKQTTAYTTAGEVPDNGAYVAGGQALAGLVVVLVGDQAFLDWTVDPAWTPASISARGALIYNSSKSNKALAVLTFPETVTSTNGLFTVELPYPVIYIGPPPGS